MEMLRYTLKVPLQTLVKATGEPIAGMEVTEVKVRPDVRARDLRALDGVEGEIGRTIALIGQLTSLTRDHVEDLSVEDFTALGEMIADFMPPGLPTGATV